MNYEFPQTEPIRNKIEANRRVTLKCFFVCKPYGKQAPIYNIMEFYGTLHVKSLVNSVQLCLLPMRLVSNNMPSMLYACEQTEKAKQGVKFNRIKTFFPHRDGRRTMCHFQSDIMKPGQEQQCYQSKGATGTRWLRPPLLPHSGRGYNTPHSLFYDSKSINDVA